MQRAWNWDNPTVGILQPSLVGSRLENMRGSKPSFAHPSLSLKSSNRDRRTRHSCPSRTTPQITIVRGIGHVQLPATPIDCPQRISNTPMAEYDFLRSSHLHLVGRWDAWSLPQPHLEFSSIPPSRDSDFGATTFLEHEALAQLHSSFSLELYSFEEEQDQG